MPNDFPHRRDPDAQPQWLLHVGLYAYRRDFLLRFASMEQTPLETTEKLEQLRALESGCIIQVVETDYEALGIDTPAEYEEFLERYQSSQGGHA